MQADKALFSSLLSGTGPHIYTALRHTRKTARMMNPADNNTPTLPPQLIVRPY